VSRSRNLPPSGGRGRQIGHSNLAGWQIAEAAHVAREIGAEPFVSAQNEWSLLERDVEREVVPASLRYGLGVLPYFPLANGMLTGKVRRATGVPRARGRPRGRNG
jgi:aryl-alcohol dehydrogenase-like predicted oxidoreductase